jgi:CheY-like chemotaxis protein
MQDTSGAGPRGNKPKLDDNGQLERSSIPRILCVDDDRALLGGLERVLGFDYEVVVESDPLAALHLLESDTRFEVVLCDMQMPRLDGAEFLIRSRQLLPFATRLVLTGEPNLGSISAAINEGGIFRLLTKPCPGEQLRSAIRAAVEQHRSLVQPAAAARSPRAAGAIQWLRPLAPPPPPALVPTRAAADERPRGAAQSGTRPALLAAKAPAVRAGSLLAVLGAVADRAIADGRTDEAARLLVAPLDMIAKRAREGKPTDRDDVEMAAILAARLAASSGDGRWLDYVFRLFTALSRLVPGRAIDEIYEGLHRSSGANPYALELYISGLEFQSRGYDATERCLLRRIQHCRGLLRSAPDRPSPATVATR